MRNEEKLKERPGKELAQLRQQIFEFEKLEIADKKLQEKLNESEQRYRILFEQAADSIVLIDTETAEMVDFNNATCENLGYSRQELQKLNIPDFEVIESPAQYRERVDKILKKGSDVFETKHRRKDGQIRNILVNCKIISLGDKKYIQSIWRDITEHKQTQIELERLYTMMHAILEKVPFGVYVVNGDGAIDYVNSAMLKISGDAYEQFKWLNIFELDTYKNIGLCEKIKSAFEGNHFVMNAVDYTSYFGKKRTIRNFSGTPLEEKDKKKVLIFVEDITKSKKMEESLKRANRELRKLSELKSEFISMVSHELRTPLAITKEGVSLIIDGVLGNIDEEQKKILIVARNNIDRLGRLIDDLLDISKIEAGKVDLNKEVVNLVEIVKEASLPFNFRIKEKNLQLQTNFQNEKIEIYGDRDKISQIFTNFISNAVKFTEKGFIEVSIEEREKEVECAIIDTGIGISNEDLPKIFGKFQQFNRSYGPGEKGTGLGLSITKKLIELHNGKVWVESEAGKGTKFTFILPKRPLALKELIADNIKGIMKNYSLFSLLIVGLGIFEGLKEELGEEKINFILKGIKHILKTKLSREDIVLNEGGCFAIILIDCAKANALRVKERIANLIQNYLIERKVREEIKLNFGCATYPEDGSREEDLIKKAEDFAEIAGADEYIEKPIDLQKIEKSSEQV